MSSYEDIEPAKKPTFIQASEEEWGNYREILSPLFAKGLVIMRESSNFGNCRNTNWQCILCLYFCCSQQVGQFCSDIQNIAGISTIRKTLLIFAW